MLSINNFKIIDLNNIFLDQNEIDNISNNTYNTWQKNRNIKEKKLDTSLGKLAEAAFEYYFKTCFNNISFLSYDYFRKDEFKKHAPFDFLIFKKKINESILNIYIDKINNEVSLNDYGKISVLLKKELSLNGIYITEVKSTRINKNRHFDNNNTLNLEKIFLDDFLEYPKYLRVSEDYSINNFKTYSNYVFDKYNIEYKDLLQEEYDNLKHLYLRCFIDEQTNLSYLIGYLTKNDFYANLDLKTMKQKDKSEKALYLFCNLRNGKDLSNLDKI